MSINDLHPVSQRIAFNAHVAKRELRQVAGVLKRSITRSYRKKLAALEKNDD